MKRPLYRLGVMLLALVLVLALPVTSFAATANEWDTSKSKTATNLDSNYISNITLSLPSAQEQLVTDVVFVLDKSTSANVTDQIVEMLRDLSDQVKSTGAEVKVGVVIFNMVANVELELTNLNNDNMPAIESAIKTKLSSGTNSHAGLLAGKKMLDDDNTVPANRKYLIFVSDGITYIYNSEPTFTAWSFNMPNATDDWHGLGSFGSWAGPDNWYSKYHTHNAPADWSTWLQDIGTKVQAQGTTYEHPYPASGQFSPATPEDIDNWDTAFAMSIDKALYLTNQVYQEAVNAEYNCYAVSANSTAASDHPWGTSFMNYLAGDNQVSFASIKNDIYYLLDAGSQVEDIIGYAEGDYNFDFINSASKLSLTVGEDAYTVSEVKEGLDENETARYHFSFEGVIAKNQAAAPFILHYYEKGVDGASAERFILDINVPVSNFAPVQLTYSVKLMNPKTEPGRYGDYDEDGSKGYTALYTNNSATLYPIDSNGNQGASDAFNKPTVSYTISAPETETPTPSFPTYYPDYSEQPVATPTPTPFVPSDETSPKTGAGDAALPALMIVALAAAGVAVVSMRKRAR